MFDIKWAADAIQPGVEAEMEKQPVYDDESFAGFARLAGKTAIITGGDSGIGRAIAIACAKEGANLLINTSSITAFVGNQQLLDYSATKGAITSFTKSLALSVQTRHCKEAGSRWNWQRHTSFWLGIGQRATSPVRPYMSMEETISAAKTVQ